MGKTHEDVYIMKLLTKGYLSAEEIFVFLEELEFELRVTLARQLSHSPSPGCFLFVCFLLLVMFLLGTGQTEILLPAVSHEAGITCVYHQAWLID
jgi:hypothetical protein